MKKKLVSIIFILFVIFAATIIIDYIGFGNTETVVVIPEGSGARDVTQILSDKKVINYSFIFRLYINKNSGKLKSGCHTMKKNMGYKKALSELLRTVPMYKATKVTIPEGYELREIAELLEEKGIISKDAFIKESQSGNFDYDFLPKTKNLEGYLFPATYELAPEMTAHQIINIMLNRFDTMLTDSYKARIKEMGSSVNDVLIMASLIEREAAIPNDRPIISSVFYNRLKIGMKLQSCATVEYILAERKSILSNEDTKIESPYNTYIHEGLPPTPIACPGEESFKAALYPAETDYLYFVADGKGGHRFSKTYEEHLANAQK